MIDQMDTLTNRIGMLEAQQVGAAWGPSLGHQLVLAGGREAAILEGQPGQVRGRAPSGGMRGTARRGARRVMMAL